MEVAPRPQSSVAPSPYPTLIDDAAADAAAGAAAAAADAAAADLKHHRVRLRAGR